MLTVEQVAGILNVSRRRVYALIRAGRLKAEKPGRDWVVAVADVDAVLTRRTRGAPRGPRKPKVEQ